MAFSIGKFAFRQPKCTRSWSRWRYVRFSTCQRFPVLPQALAACFEALGSVSAHVMFDNAKTITGEFVAGLSVLNAELDRLATHYRFTPVRMSEVGPNPNPSTAPAPPLRRGRARRAR